MKKLTFKEQLIDLKNKKLDWKEKKHQQKNQKWKEKYGLTYDECVRKRKKRKGFKNFFSLLKVYDKKSAYFMLILFGIFIALVGLLEPIFLQKSLDEISDGMFKNAIVFIAIYSGVVVCLKLLGWTYRICSERIYQKIAFGIRQKATDRILGTKISKFNSTASGEILNRSFSDVYTYSSAVVNVMDYFTEIFWCLGYIVYAMYLNFWLGLMLTLIGFVTFLIRYIYNKKYQPVCEKRTGKIYDNTLNIVNESIRGVRDVKCLNLKSYLRKNIISNYDYLKNSTFNRTLLNSGYKNVAYIVQAILVFVFFVASIYFMDIEVLSISAFFIIIVYRFDIFDMFNNISSTIENMKTGEVYAERINELFNEENYPQEKFGDVNIENIQGKIEFKNVKFSYGDKELFKDLNLLIKPKECIGLVGKSGEGKSTIMSLIAKLNEVSGGEILIDDTNINDISEDCLRNAISVVSQTPYVFNLSVAENLRLAKPDASQEELENACKKAYVHDLILNLPNGYDTKIGENGTILSGGQRQRLAIARALLKDSKIILFDEATSALDNESQEKIKQAINDIKQEKTIVIVAHRLTTIKDCDRIFVISKNDVVANGSHNELIKSCKVYKNLYETEID